MNPEIETTFTVNNNYKPTSKPEIELPGEGRTITEFACELGDKLKKAEIFSRNDFVFGLNSDYTELVPVSPDAFRTLVERYATCYVGKYNKETKTRYKTRKTMPKSDAQTVLASREFLVKLRPIDGLNHIPLPVRRPCGKIELLPAGYDALSKTFTSSGMHYEVMPINTARAFIDDLLQDFPFKDDISNAVAVSAMLSVFAYGILPEGSLRPFFLYDANAEGAGKTLLMKTAVVPVAGYCPSCPAPETEQEMKKTLDAAMIAGRGQICFDNVKKDLDSPSLEGLLTNQTWTGRVLGESRLFKCKNYAFVFITGNGCSVSSDLRRRKLVCSLHLEDEKAEYRQFSKRIEVPFLLEKRPQILSALWSFVVHWIASGKPEATGTHSSFPDWASIIGGIVTAAGYECPFAEHQSETVVDNDGEDMRQLAFAIFSKHQSEELTFKQVADIAVANELFCRQLEGINGPQSERAKSAFGKTLKRFSNRNVGDFHIVAIGERHSRRYKVSKVSKVVQSVEVKSKSLQ